MGVDATVILVVIALAVLVWFAISASEKTSQPATHQSPVLSWKTVGES